MPEPDLACLHLPALQEPSPSILPWKESIAILGTCGPFLLYFGHGREILGNEYEHEHERCQLHGQSLWISCPLIFKTISGAAKPIFLGKALPRGDLANHDESFLGTSYSRWRVLAKTDEY